MPRSRVCLPTAASLPMPMTPSFLQSAPNATTVPTTSPNSTPRACATSSSAAISTMHRKPSCMPSRRPTSGSSRMSWQCCNVSPSATARSSPYPLWALQAATARPSSKTGLCNCSQPTITLPQAPKATTPKSASPCRYGRCRATTIWRSSRPVSPRPARWRPCAMSYSQP